MPISRESVDFIKTKGSHVLAVGHETGIDVYAVITRPTSQLQHLATLTTGQSGCRFKLGARGDYAIVYVDVGIGVLSIYQAKERGAPLELVAEGIYPEEITVSALEVRLLQNYCISTCSQQVSGFRRLRLGGFRN